MAFAPDHWIQLYIELEGPTLQSHLIGENAAGISNIFENCVSFELSCKFIPPLKNFQGICEISLP